MIIGEKSTPTTQHPPATLEERLARFIALDAEKVAYLVIFILAVLTRFWDLGVRVMSHDESLHVRYAWNLYRGQGFAHTPLMHGPLLFHMTALSYLLFGDNDFTGRIYTAVVGVIVVMFPYFLRRWLGKTGALVTSSLLLISPLILYYSRYIRHDMPAILGALIMVYAMLHYIEQREFKFLIWLALGQFVLFASKEVSFIYIAIFGSFLLLFFITRLLEAEWPSRALRWTFNAALIGLLAVLIALGLTLIWQGRAGGEVSSTAETTAETITPLNPQAAAQSTAAVTGAISLPVWVEIGLLALLVVVLVASVLIGQWHNLRRFPELDVAVAIGSLILPALTPFLIFLAGYDPMDMTQQGITRSTLFTLPAFAIAVLVGLIHFMRPPLVRHVAAPSRLSDEEKAAPANDHDATTDTLAIKPDLLDWLAALASSRWWVIGLVYWLPFIFFFTTMFTNGAGIGTGVIGSLGYWLSQHEVRRGGQPWYYYLMIMVPLYEFLPLILTLAAGAAGLGRWSRSWIGALKRSREEPLPSPRHPLDLDAPVRFPALLLFGYWTLLNFIAYSVAGEKMPWLTTHLTLPMILIGGWALGRLLESTAWRRLWETHAWVLFLLVPVATVALMRVAGPLCAYFPRNLLCNTVIPAKFQAGAFGGYTVTALTATSSWLSALVVLSLALAALIKPLLRVGVRQFARVVALLFTGWLVFLTARTAWRAAYINYDYANEFLVYAHSAGAVKEVMAQIEEISLRITDGYGLRVAYDNHASWPMTWYLRNYYNAVYYGDQPSRGLIGDAPVIIAGPGNWSKVESLIGDRYYRFEYIRMWWPMQDYFGYEDLGKMRKMLTDVLRDPALQRGLWEIFLNRNYDAYADAVAKYRGGTRPNFELSNWPIAEHMRVYIRKDIFAQVWQYGVAASEIAAATDPYSEKARHLLPDFIFGQGQLNRPHALAVGPNGLLYVADTNNHRVAVFDTEGNLVNTFGTYGLAPQPDVFNEPWGLAVAPDGTVYVADTWNHRIVAYSPEGERLREWGVEGANQFGNLYGFWGPRAVAVDAQGLVYVADTGNKRIMVYDGEGTFIRQIGSGGALEGQLDEPVGLAFGTDGRLYVADTWNQRIQVFTQEGIFVRQWSIAAWFGQSNERPYLAVDAENNVYVTDPDAGRVIVFDSFGNYLYSFGDLSTIGLAGGITVDNAGHVYLTDTANGTVQRYALGAEDEPAQ